MEDNTLTFALEGDVSLEKFTQAMIHFRNLINELAREVAAGISIEWLIEELGAGSALATIAGIADSQEPVLNVIDAYAKVGQSLQYREPIPFSRAVEREAKSLTQVVGNDVTELRLITAKSEAIIYGVFDQTGLGKATLRVSFGSVKGKVQSLTSRGRLQFTLYDSIFDKAISCYLQLGQEEKMRDIWGKMVIVSGYITRGSEDGQPKSIRDIHDIEVIFPKRVGSYRVAKGALPWQVGDESAETSIRRIRDHEN